MSRHSPIVFIVPVLSIVMHWTLVSRLVVWCHHLYLWHLLVDKVLIGHGHLVVVSHHLSFIRLNQSTHLLDTRHRRNHIKNFMVWCGMLLDYRYHPMMWDTATLVLVFVDECALRTPLTSPRPMEVLARIGLWSSIEQPGWSARQLNVTWEVGTLNWLALRLLDCCVLVISFDHHLLKPGHHLLEWVYHPINRLVIRSWLQIHKVQSVENYSSLLYQCN